MNHRNGTGSARRRMFRVTPVVAMGAAIVLLLAGIAFPLANEQLYREQKLREAQVQARILAASVTASLAFDDHAAAQEYVNALRENPEVLAVGVYLSTGAPIAMFAKEGQEVPGAAPPSIDAEFTDEGLVVTSLVSESGAVLGRVYLRIVTQPAMQRVLHYGGAALLVLMAALFVALLARAQSALTKANAGLASQADDLVAANRCLHEQIRERERVEGALRHSQKMEATGRLTGGIAHDFNNHLQVIGANLQLLRTADGLSAKSQRHLEGAMAGVERAAKLTAQLLVFARRQPLDPQPVNLGRIVRNMGELLQRTLGEGIDVQTMVAGSLWTVEVDVHQAENAILNLAVNARDAMGGKGRITLELGNAELDRDATISSDEEVSGEFVVLAVGDTGCGMPPEQIERIFEPFYTTKPMGEGTGLGLPMVHGFVNQSGGHVKVHSEVDRGTTVRIYLPRTLKAETIALPVEPVTRGGTETVLVVEDDRAVRDAVAEMLGSLGYNALWASEPTEALALLQRRQHIDLLFTDVVMPGPVSTPDFVRRARQLRPAMKVLYTSGYTGNVIDHHGRLDEGVMLLSKPYTRPVLAAKLRQVLDERPAAAPRRVLVVEDEVLVRIAVVEFLRDDGWEVAEVGTAEEAQAMLAEQSFALLLTDITLPGLDGEKLAAQVRRDHPGTAVILATGRSPSASTAGMVVLSKPYSKQALDKAIAEAVGSPRPTQQ